MEKQPSFNRIIGGTEEQKERLQKKTEVESQKTGEELFGEYIVEPDEDEKVAIKEAVEYANKTAAYYGAVRTTDPKRIFLLKPNGVEAVTDGRTKHGVFDSLDQSIAVDRTDSNILLAMGVVHESFHMSSHQAAQIFEGGDGGSYRSGIEMRGREKEGNYFGVAQEAIIATLSRNFFDEVITRDPLYKKEIEKTKAIKDWVLAFIERNITNKESRIAMELVIQDILLLPESDDVYHALYESNEDDEYKFGFFRGYFEEELELGDIMQERSEERDKFNEILDEIISGSNGQLNDKQELFEEFAHAHFTGNYLPLARKIEGVLGKGTFRKIAIDLGEMKTDNQ